LDNHRNRFVGYNYTIPSCSRWRVLTGRFFVEPAKPRSEAGYDHAGPRLRPDPAILHVANHCPTGDESGRIKTLEPGLLVGLLRN
jgi:hypothetical protein